MHKSQCWSKSVQPGPLLWHMLDLTPRGVVGHLQPTAHRLAAGPTKHLLGCNCRCGSQCLESRPVSACMANTTYRGGRSNPIQITRGQTDVAATVHTLKPVRMHAHMHMRHSDLRKTRLGTFTNQNTCSSVISVNGWHELFELHSYRCNIDLI
jgi:hypothetical protein